MALMFRRVTRIFYFGEKVGRGERGLTAKIYIN
jgi:hypothetical protein